MIEILSAIAEFIIILLFFALIASMFGALK